MTEQKISRFDWVAGGLVLGFIVGGSVVWAIFTSAGTAPLGGYARAAAYFIGEVMAIVGAGVGAGIGWTAASWLLRQPDPKAQAVKLMKVALVVFVIYGLGLYSVYLFLRLPPGCPPNCSGADLSGATNLEGVNLKEANLREANLHRAELTYADLSGADLSGATNLEGVNLKEAQYNTDTLWPEGFDPAAAGAILVE